MTKEEIVERIKGVLVEQYDIHNVPHPTMYQSGRADAYDYAIQLVELHLPDLLDQYAKEQSVELMRWAQLKGHIELDWNITSSELYNHFTEQKQQKK